MVPSTSSYDLIVAGGGPAGLTAARAAAEQGLSALLLEKSLEIGYPIHTSGGSWTRELKEFGIPDRFIHPVKTLEVISSNAHASFDYTPAEICFIDTRAVYQYLAEQASLAGTLILTNTTVREPLLEDGRLCGVKAVRNGAPVEFRARLVIDASGFSSVIEGSLGLRKPPSGYGKGAEYELITSAWQQDKSTLLLGSSFVPVGYAWIFPYGEHRVRVGFGVISPLCRTEPLSYLDKFLSSDHPVAQQLKPFSIVETHFGSVPNTGYLSPSYADNLLIAGDAAGQVLCVSEEGIRLALEIGTIAGETAAEAIRKDDTSAAFLQQYETRWKKKYARSIELNARLNAILSTYSDAQWDRAVRIIKDVDPAIILALMKGNFDLNLVKLILTRNPGLLAHNAIKLIKKAITG
jgi:digeranylgeranylglycerophospholipid reductase